MLVSDTDSDSGSVHGAMCFLCGYNSQECVSKLDWILNAQRLIFGFQDGMSTMSMCFYKKLCYARLNPRCFVYIAAMILNACTGNFQVKFIRNLPGCPSPTDSDVKRNVSRLSPFSWI